MFFLYCSENEFPTVLFFLLSCSSILGFSISFFSKISGVFRVVASSLNVFAVLSLFFGFLLLLVSAPPRGAPKTGKQNKEHSPFFHPMRLPPISCLSERGESCTRWFGHMAPTRHRSCGIFQQGVEIVFGNFRAVFGLPRGRGEART